MKICALIPTYNNVTTAASVVRQALEHLPVIVVVDGASDGTLDTLNDIKDGRLTIVSYEKNRGKGYALKIGFKKAREMGYTHVLTMDSDGQHYATEIPKLVRMARVHSDSIIVGSRKLRHKNMPGKSTFANRFSNFWFAVQTGRHLPDTQTGMRIYPLDEVHGECFMTDRYEAELALLVFSAWANVLLIPVPIEVFYPEKSERVSFFKPAKDFTRISILNTFLTLLAIVYGLPRRWLPSLWYGLIFLLDAVVYINPALLLFKLTGRKGIQMRMLRSNAWFLMKMLPKSKYGIKYENGATKIGSDGPEVIICNHNSFLDSQIMLTLGVDCACLAHAWIGRNPFFGAPVRASGTIFADKPIEEMLPELKRVTEAGKSLFIYPEGTRSLSGAIGRFHPGAFYIAEQLGLPVRPIFEWDMYQTFGKAEFHVGMPKSNTVRIYPSVKVSDYKVCCKQMLAWYRELEENTESLN